jgi:Flp pilus assembly protein TadG
MRLANSEPSPTRQRRLPRGRSGQALVEFAIVLPILMLLVIGIIDFGFAFNSWGTTQNAAREAARAAAVTNSVSTIKNRATVAGSSIDVAAAEISLACNRPTINNTFYDCTKGLNGSGTCTNGPCSAPGTWHEMEGDIVRITVDHPYRFRTPLPSLVGLGATVTLKASIQTRYEG